MAAPIIATPTPLGGTPTVNARGIRAAQAGLLVNAVLTVVKLLAGILGNSYALIADAFESMFDILGSFVVWGGLQISSRSPNADYPFGFGRAEALASAVVSLMLLGAAVGIGIEAVREIVTPHHAPAPFTLVVLVAVIVIKYAMARRVNAIGAQTGSSAVKADAAHHLSDAITSVAAFIGISVALWKGPGYESADDWGALIAAAVILFNGVRLLNEAVHELMDRTPSTAVMDQIARAASEVPSVLAIEKLKVRKLGAGYWVEIHVQADPTMPLFDAHALGGAVKYAIRGAVPLVHAVLVHMEPFEEPAPVAAELPRTARLS
jgi:cation diffusion facilitator family transporter